MPPSEMNIQSITPTTERPLLKWVLLTNTAFSTLSGIMCIVGAGSVAAFSGLQSPIPMLILGGLLLFFAYDVYKISRQSPIAKNKARLVLWMDVLWVVASAILLIADPFSFTTEGRWAILVIADVVMVFAILEFIGLRTAQ